MKHIYYSTGNSPNKLQKLLTLIVAVVLIILGLMFSAALFSVIFVVIIIFWVFLWWKLRPIRKKVQQMQEVMRDFEAQNVSRESDIFRGEVFKGEIIEGEVIRKDESEDKVGR